MLAYAWTLLYAMQHYATCNAVMKFQYMNGLSYTHNDLLNALLECINFYLYIYIYIYANQKHLGCKKGEANQKQQLSGYEYIAILVTKSFDIS